MKRFLLSCLTALLATIASATTGTATDVNTSAIGPYVTLVRQGSWGVAGLGGAENSYIFSPTTTQSVSCVYIANNNPSNPHSYTLNFLTTGDPTITKYATASTAIQSKWHLISTISDTVSANLVKVYSFFSLAASSAQIQITSTATAAGSPDTVDMYIVQAPTNIDCSSSSIPIGGNATINTNGLCNLSAVGTAASGAKAVVVAAPAAGKFVHVCAATFGGGVWTTNATMDLSTGNASDCSTITATNWSVMVPNTAEPPNSVGGGSGQILQTTTAAKPLCLVNNTLGATAVVSVAYYVQ